MTTLIVNEKETFDIQVKDDASVFDVLLAAQEKHWDPSCAINSLTINGEFIQPLNESSLMGIPAEGAEINISLSEPRNQSVKQVLADSVAYLKRLATGFEELSEKIRSGADKESYSMLFDGLEGLSTILELANALFNSEVIPEELRAQFLGFMGELKEKSQELTEAQEGGDPTLIADILEYEFSDSVKELEEYLTKITPLVM